MIDETIDEIDYTPMLPFARYYGLADEVLEILTRPNSAPYSHKVMAIKHVRAATGWFLFESKKFVDYVTAIVDTDFQIDLIAFAEKAPQRDYDNEASH